MLLLMPVTMEQRIKYENEWQRRREVGKNVTTTDLEKAEKRPRMPPTRWEDATMLLTTWALLVKMLFGGHNAHLKGVNAIRRHLLSLADTKACYSRRYFANVIWAVLDDAVRHFNMTVPYADLERAKEDDILQFPTTRLHDIARTLSMQGSFEMGTFPAEWDQDVNALEGGGRVIGSMGYGGGRSYGGGGGRGGGGGGGTSQTADDGTTNPYQGGNKTQEQDKT